MTSKSNKDDNDDNDERYKLIPLTEKYRPRYIDDIYLLPLIKHRIINIINTMDMPNLILTGPPGIGKSSSVEILARELFGIYYKDTVVELNLLDEKGLKFIQNGIIQFCKTQIPYQEKDKHKYPSYKLIIFNEADNVTNRIQDQISNIMEKFGDKVRFAFTCNSSEDLIESIQTKCIPWRYSFLDNNEIIDRLEEICKKENISHTKKALKKIASISQGDLRSAINKLQLIYCRYNSIEEKYVYLLCNIPQETIVKDLFTRIIDKDLKGALQIVFNLKKNSFSGSDITMGMLTTLKMDICNDINNEIRIELGKHISNGIYKISDITDSNLQLTGCIVDMIQGI